MYVEFYYTIYIYYYIYIYIWICIIYSYVYKLMSAYVGEYVIRYADSLSWRRAMAQTTWCGTRKKTLVDEPLEIRAEIHGKTWRFNVYIGIIS